MIKIIVYWDARAIMNIIEIYSYKVVVWTADISFNIDLGLMTQGTKFFYHLIEKYC